MLLSGTVAAGAVTNNFSLSDSLGLAVDLGLVASTIPFATNTGTGSIGAVQKFLQSMAIVVRGFNFNSTDSTQIENALKAIYANIDGDFKSKTLFAAQYVSMVANNPNLLNVNIPFVLTFNTILKVPFTVPGAGSTTFSYTFKDMVAIPYGRLSDFLNQAQIADVSNHGI